MHGYKVFLNISALLALGCGGNAVDLGHSPNRGWSDLSAQDPSATTPQTIYASEDAIFGFALDGDTLYALITHLDTLELVSCPLDRCRSERKILFSGPWPDHPSAISTPLVLSGGWLYWIVANGEPHGIAACSATGCAQPSFVQTDVRGAIAGDGEGVVYWFDQNGSLMRIAAGASSAERVREGANELSDPLSLSVQGDYIYFNDLGSGSSSIRRVRKDGTGAAELVVTDDEIWDFSVTDDAIYYASEILTGRVVECPLDDCLAGGTTLAANQRYPEGVQVDRNEVFWLNNQRFSRLENNTRQSLATLLSCVLPDCASVQKRLSDVALDGSIPVQHLGPRFAFSSNAVVWLEQFHGAGASLRRLSR